MLYMRVINLFYDICLLFGVVFVAELLATDGQGHHRHDMGQKRKEDTEDTEVERTRIQLLNGLNFISL